MKELRNCKFLFTDIDGTLTNDGRIPWEAYRALWLLKESGVSVVPVSGRPSGWGDHIARFWPVDGVIVENGALYFRMKNGKMAKTYFEKNIKEIMRQKAGLEDIKQEVFKQFPNARLASDQPYREFDLAIDFSEDVNPSLSDKEVRGIVEIYIKHGAAVKISAIHINGWFGSYDKLKMVNRYCESEVGKSLDLMNRDGECAFVGDSPNDEVMFQAFRLSFGVANLKKMSHWLKHLPPYIMSKEGGYGFTELAQMIIDAKKPYIY